MTTYGFSRDLTPRRKIDTPVSEVKMMLVARLVAMWGVQHCHDWHRWHHTWTNMVSGTTCQHWHACIYITLHSHKPFFSNDTIMTIANVLLFSADWTDARHAGSVWQGAPRSLTGSQTWHGGDGVQWRRWQNPSHWANLQWKVSDEKLSNSKL